MERGETIGIFGDYDCDGITAAALLARMLRRHGSEPVIRLPHRIRDGYGLKESHVDWFAARGVTLLLTVDTGIGAHAAVARGAARAMDVIIMDHHEPPSVVPAAHSILHPAFSAEPPAHAPCAAGIAFHVVALVEGAAWRGRDEDAALAMLGTVADLVPLLDGNRAIVREGIAALARLREGPLATLAAHVRTSGRPLSSVDVAFRIAPRINAAGRMADPMLALSALLEGGDALRELETLNAQRQEETMIAVERSLLQLGPAPADPFLCVADEEFSPGIIGLIAGKLTERFGRPSMAVSIQGEECVASLRSPPAYSIIDGLRACEGLLTSFGGHRQAAGCTFRRSALDDIRDALSRHVRETIPETQLVPTLSIDAPLPLSSITLPFIRQLSALEPFGQGNPEPQFLVPAVSLGMARTVGGDGRHLQGRAGRCKLIGFGLGPLIAHARSPLDLVCRLGVDAWNGREEPQLQVVDMRKTMIDGRS